MIQFVVTNLSSYSPMLSKIPDLSRHQGCRTTYPCPNAALDLRCSQLRKLPLVKHRNIDNNSNDDVAGASPAIRHAVLRGLSRLALHNHLHVFLNPIKDIAATVREGKT
jgi:hypothetical protein